MLNKEIKFSQDKQKLTSATLKLLEEVVDMAPQVGVHITPKYQSALAMVLTGMPYKQAALMLGVNSTAVSVYAHQAVEELKQLPEAMSRLIEEMKPCEEEVEEPSSSDVVETEPMRIQYDTKIRDLPGAEGCYAVITLEDAGIKTVGQLCSRNRREIANIPGMRLRMHSIDMILEESGFWYSIR